MKRTTVTLLAGTALINQFGVMQAQAGTGTITVLDSGGVTRTYAVITTSSSVATFVSQMGVCDGTAAAQCAAVDAGKSLQIAGEGTAGSPAGGVVSVQGVASGTNLPVAQATASALNA